MRPVFLLATALMLLPAAYAQSCDRACLKGVIDKYLDTLVKHDPSKMPLDPKVRFTEDSDEMKVGEGLWATIEGLDTFRQDILDVKGGTAGVHFVAKEGGNPVLVGTRLKVVNGKVTEMESLVVRNAAEGMIFNVGSIKEASAKMNVMPTAAQRNTREEMIEMALRYPGGLKVGSFVKSDAKFSPEAYRFENGQLMAGPGCTFIAGCANIREQSLPTLAGITARVAAVDEEQGIVWLRMNFGSGSVMGGGGGRGKGGAKGGPGGPGGAPGAKGGPGGAPGVKGGPPAAKGGPAPGGAVAKGGAKGGPGGAPGGAVGGNVLDVLEMFKIYDGQIQAVEAFMQVTPQGKPSGWE